MDFSHFFDKMESQESYAILFITIVGFLLGLLVGFLLRSAKVGRLKKELKVIKKKLTDAETELNLQTEQLTKKEAELEAAKAEARDLVAKMEALDADREKLYKDVYALNTEVEEFQSADQDYGSTIEDLHNQVIALQDKNETLQLDLNVAQAAPAASNNEDLQSLQRETNSRLTLFEAKLDTLAAENALLKSEISHVQTTGTLTSTTSESEEPILVGSTEKKVLKRRIITETHKDDLKLIEGVGPFIEKQLNDAGIFTYEQISQFDTETIERVTREIGYFPGRIQKDDWIGQAKKLMKSSHKKRKGKKKKSTYPSNDQDLKIIEGIGPKIESILKTAGINNWTELAAASKKRIREILDEAGNRYKIHDPETWAKQATLAANEKWDELKELQDKLDGGRK